MKTADRTCEGNNFFSYTGLCDRELSVCTLFFFFFGLLNWFTTQAGVYTHRWTGHFQEKQAALVKESRQIYKRTYKQQRNQCTNGVWHAIYKRERTFICLKNKTRNSKTKTETVSNFRMKHKMKYESQSCGERKQWKKRHKDRKTWGSRPEKVTEDSKPKIMKEGKSHILSEIQQLCPKNRLLSAALVPIFYETFLWEQAKIFHYSDRSFSCVSCNDPASSSTSKQQRMQA